MSSNLLQHRGRFSSVMAHGIAAFAIALLGSGCFQIGIVGAPSSSSSAISSSVFHSQWIDSSGNLFIADTGNNVIRKVNSSGTISSFPTPNLMFANLPSPEGMTFDHSGNLYIADPNSDVVYEANLTTNTISVAMAGADYTVDGDPATAVDVAVDSSNNLYFADPEWNRILKFNPTTETVTVAAGETGLNGYSGDGGAATAETLWSPWGVALDTSNNLYISDTINCAIRMVSAATGIISTVAGTPLGCGYAGDGGLATAAQLNWPQGVAVDTAGNIYIVDTNNSIVRKVTVATGVISTVAGTPSTPGYTGDTGLATLATLNAPQRVKLDSAGNIYISDQGNNVIRKVTVATGIITTVAGGGAPYGDGGPATDAQVNTPWGLALDGSNNLYISDEAGEGVAPGVREVSSTTGIISTIVGEAGQQYSSFSNGQNTKPSSVLLDSAGNVYYADSGDNVIRKMSPSGVVTTVAGDYSLGAGYGGDAGPATSAQLNDPTAIALDGSGNLYIADSSNNVIRKVDTSGNIWTVAGNGTAGYPGHGNQAETAELTTPYGVAVDTFGDLYIADSGNNVIRKVVVSTGLITTVIGNYSLGSGYSGDGGPASNAALNTPTGLAFDSEGNLFIADTGNNVVRKVDTAGNIWTVAGDGVAGNTSHGNEALSSELNAPTGVGLDSAGNLYIADVSNNQIRMVTPAGIISTVAGNGTAGYSGDGGAATSAELNGPNSVIPP